MSGEPSSRVVAGVDVAYVAERHEVGEVAAEFAFVGGEQETDMVAEFEPAEDLAGEPGRGIVQDGQPVRTLAPAAVRELVHLVAGLPAEQRGQRQVPLVEDVHGEMVGRGGHPERAVLVGQAHEEPRWVDPRLGGETDQAPAAFVRRARGHHEHRIVEAVHDRGEPVARAADGIGHRRIVRRIEAGRARLIGRRARVLTLP